MAKIKRNCNNCKKEYDADTRSLKRGWGLNCSKSCAASSREKGKPSYNKERVARNNARRENWGNENKERWARKRGYPSFEDYEREYFDGDGVGILTDVQYLFVNIVN